MSQEARDIGGEEARAQDEERSPDGRWRCHMDMGVMLVQTYLRAHGYFTVSEYPILEAMHHGDHRVATDIDILAVRFPQACQLVPRQGRYDDGDVAIETPDDALGMVHDNVDMIIGEVKIGTAELNHAATDPAVLRAALMRFGCCGRDDTARVVDALLRDGRTINPAGHHIRMVAFGSIRPSRPHPTYQVILLGDVLRFLRRHLRAHGSVLHHADFKDPAFSFLMMLEKAEGAVQAVPQV